VNGETRSLLQYFRFHSKTINEVLDLLEWVVKDTYELENITNAFGMPFSEPCAFHVRLVYEEKFVASYAPPTFVRKCVSLMCDLCDAFNHNFDLYSHYVRLKVEIENNMKIAFSM